MRGKKDLNSLAFVMLVLAIAVSCADPSEPGGGDKPVDGTVTVTITGLADGASVGGGTEITHGSSFVTISMRNETNDTYWDIEVVTIDSASFSWTSDTIAAGTDISFILRIWNPPAVQIYEMVDSVKTDKCKATVDGNATISLVFSDTEFRLP